MGHQRPIGRLERQQPVEAIADRADDLHIGAFVVAADVVLAAGPAQPKNVMERAGMVLDMEPIADLQAVAVDRDRLTFERVEDRERDQLLRKVIRPVIVRAVGDDGRKPIGRVPGGDQVIGRCLGGRIGRVRAVGGVLAEASAGRKRTVDFVSRYMNEPEVFGAGRARSRPATGDFEQVMLVSTKAELPVIERST